MNRTLVTLAALSALALAPGHLLMGEAPEGPELAIPEGGQNPGGPPGGTNLQARVEALEADVAALQTGQTDLQGNVATLQGDVADLQAGQGTLQGGVSSLQTDVGDLGADHALLVGDVIALQGDVATLFNEVIPVGTVVAWTDAVPPPGWLLCNGVEVSRADFPELHSVIGFAHGGDGVDAFNLPDYRGRFLRGVDGGAGNDPDAFSRAAMNPGGNAGNAVGSVQGGATARPSFDFLTSGSGNHSHGLGGGSISFNNLQFGGAFGDADGGPKFAAANFRTWNFVHQHPAAGDHTHSVNRGGDNETRPVNAYVNWIIKAE